MVAGTSCPASLVLVLDVENDMFLVPTYTCMLVLVLLVRPSVPRILANAAKLLAPPVGEEKFQSTAALVLVLVFFQTEIHYRFWLLFQTGQLRIVRACRGRPSCFPLNPTPTSTSRRCPVSAGQFR